MKKPYKNRYSKKSHKPQLSSVVVKKTHAITPTPVAKVTFRPSAFATSLYALDKFLSRVHNQARAFFNRTGGYSVFEIDGYRYYQASGFFTKCRDTAEYLAKHY